MHDNDDEKCCNDDEHDYVGDDEVKSTKRSHSARQYCMKMHPFFVISEKILRKNGKNWLSIAIGKTEYNRGGFFGVFFHFFGVHLFKDAHLLWKICIFMQINMPFYTITTFYTSSIEDAHLYTDKHSVLHLNGMFI